MANIAVFPFTVSIVGDNVATSVVVNLGFTPTAATVISAYDSAYGSVTANIASVVPGSSNVTINFVAPFSGSILVLLTLSSATCSSAQLQPVTGTITAVSASRTVGNAGATLDATTNAATAPANGIATLGVYQSTVPVLTAGQSVAHQTDTAGSQYVNTEGRKATYRAAVGGTTALAQGTSSPCLTLQGSATKTVRITHIEFGGWSAGTGANVTAFLRRYSVMTPGTAVTLTPAKLDANDAAATAVAQNWIGVATSTATALFSTKAVTVPTTAVSQVDSVAAFDFGQGPGAHEMVLRGVSDWVGISFSAVGTTPTALASGWIEWTEE